MGPKAWCSPKALMTLSPCPYDSIKGVVFTQSAGLQHGSYFLQGSTGAASARVPARQPQIKPQIKPQLKPQIKPQIKAQIKAQIINQTGLQATSGFEMCFATHAPKTSALP